MDILSGVLSKSWASLGRCTVCMRKAFQAATVAWCLTLGLGLLGVDALWQWFAMALAVGITALWLGHLFAYSVKALGRPPCGNEEVSGAGTTRREALGRFVNAFAFIAAATAIPAFSQSCPECGADVMEGNRGWGPCGQSCRFADGRTMTCDPCTRPVVTRDGNCYCCKFRECG
jgi:hypothetical protein